MRRSAIASIASRMHPSRPGMLFMQKHWDVMRSDNGGEAWHEVSGNLPHGLRVPDREFTRTSRRPSTWSRSRATRSISHPRGSCGCIAAEQAETNGKRSPSGLPQKDCYVNVLRDAMAVDSLEPCGVYFGTTGGQVYASADAGDTWNPIVRDLPAVLSVEVQTLA